MSVQGIQYVSPAELCECISVKSPIRQYFQPHRVPEASFWWGLPQRHWYDGEEGRYGPMQGQPSLLCPFLLYQQETRHIRGGIYRRIRCREIVTATLTLTCKHVENCTVCSDFFPLNEVN